jgi:hypothetical protein
VHRVEGGLVHGYLRARHCSTRAAESFGVIVTELQRLGAPAPGRVGKVGG